MDNTYLDTEVKPKIAFYTRYAKINRILYVGTQTLIVLLAALTPIFAALESGLVSTAGANPQLTYTLISSSVLAVLEGISRLFRFKNLWLRYRNTSNNLLNEVRQFTNTIGDYKDCEDALAQFKSRTEAYIQQEQSAWYDSLKQE